MKTIELICGEKKVQFTTRSVTFDGKEFFYSNMSHVSHNVEECAYTFTYDGENKVLPYEAKDEKILAAIFGQVKMLEAKKAEAQSAAAAPAESDKPAEEAKPAVTEDKPAEDTEKTDGEEPVDEGMEEPVKEEPAKEELSAEEKKAAKQAEKEKRKAEKQAAKEKRKAEKLAKKESANTAENNDAENLEEKHVDPEKSARKKKSFIVFGIILVIFAVVCAIYFFVFGTSEDPSQIVPNATESQQYDEIDEIINDLQ